MIAPILDEIATERAGAVKVAKINVDESPELSARYGVRSIPTLLLIKGGEVGAQIVGMVSKKDLLSKLDALV